MFETFDSSIDRVGDPMGKPASAEFCFKAAAVQAVIIWIFVHHEMGLGFLPSVFLILIIGNALRANGARLTEEYRSQVRNTLAERLLARARARALDDSEFFLYLRPFFLDDKLPVNNPIYHPAPVRTGHYSQTSKTDVESLLSELVWQESTFLKIGGKRMASGACEITTSDHEWQDLFLYIAEKARLILFIPSASTGCLWEIKKITENGWLWKTLLVMPPVVSKANAHFRDSWDSTRAEWEKEGFELPPLSPLGAMFAYDSQKKLSYCIPFPHTAKALREVLAR